MDSEIIILKLHSQAQRYWKPQKILKFKIIFFEPKKNDLSLRMYENIRVPPPPPPPPPWDLDLVALKDFDYSCSLWYKRPISSKKVNDVM